MIGLVLAGGKSTRFGRDKALYHCPHERVNNAELAVNKLRLLSDEVIVSANAKNGDALATQFQAVPTITVVTDQAPFVQHGPLSGIYAACCRHPQTTDYLVLAVDYPRITPNVLAAVADHPNCFAATPAASHYTIAHFSVSRNTLRDFLLLGDFRLGQFIEGSRQCLPLTFPNSESFTNYNYLEEINHAD